MLVTNETAVKATKDTCPSTISLHFRMVEWWPHKKRLLSNILQKANCSIRYQIVKLDTFSDMKMLWKLSQTLYKSLHPTPSSWIPKSTCQEVLDNWIQSLPMCISSPLDMNEEHKLSLDRMRMIGLELTWWQQTQPPNSSITMELNEQASR